MAMREEFPIGMMAVESHANLSDFLVPCGFGVIGIAAAVGAIFATNLTTVLVRVLG